MKLSGRQATGAQGGQGGEADPAIFDRQHLHQYTNGEPALERELVTLFLGHFAPVRTQLETAASAHDWKFAAHSLKGSARSIGAPQIASLAEQLETMGFVAPETSKKRALDALDAAMAAFADEAKKTAE
jgi:HPt (histidine-containing phosphotransfer) domain-containing protein